MQLVLIGASVAIIFTYIIPKFEETKQIQDDLFTYTDAVSKATQYNDRLRELIAIKNSLPQEGVLDVENFIPNTIDEMEIMHDIETVFAVNNVLLTRLESTPEVAPESSDVAVEGEVYAEDGSAIAPEEAGPVGVTYQDFKLIFATSYAGLKSILTVLEQNSALLEVSELKLKAPVLDEESLKASLTKIEDQELSLELTLRAYGLTASSQ